MPRRERPLDDGDDRLLRFAADLRRLRAKAGNPSYRELAKRAHYSAGTLSEAAGGRKLPTMAVTTAYAKACGADPAEWEARWRSLAEELDRPDTSETASETPPYVGLRSFGPKDANRFFGRERLVEKVGAQLRLHRFVAVLGASGSGKSSLLRAGLVPALGPHPVLLITPGAHPLRECAVHLAARLGVTPGGLLAELSGDPRNLGLATRQLLARQAVADDVVLIVDQFEETFTLCPDPAERAAFVAALVAAARDPDSRTRVILGVRTDFYTHCARHPGLAEVLQDSQVLVGPMTTEELRRIITQPAVDMGYRVEAALVSRLIADATGQPGVLPLVSHALLEAWGRRRGNTVTLAGYEATGGIEHAVARTSEEVYSALGPERQALTRQIFLRLTALGEGTEDTKRRITRGEIDHPDTAAVLEKLAGARLVTLDDDTVEIAHEEVIRSWPRLRDWLTEDREGLRIHRRITEAAQAWESENRDEGALYRGVRLALARDWAAENHSLLSPGERGFLEAGIAAEAREQEAARRRTRRLRQFAALLAVLLVLATTTTVYAFRAQRTATQQRDIALSQKVAAEATDLRDANPALSAQLSLAAYRLSPTVDARNSLLGTFAVPYATRLTGHGSRVNAVAVSTDGRMLVTASRDHTAQVWDVGDPHRPRRLLTLTGHRDNVNGAAFSPDGRVIATAAWDNTARLWDITAPGRPRPLAVLPHSMGVNAVVFSPDGQTVATAGSDKTARLWNVRDHRLRATLAGHGEGLVSVAFSPDGRTLATASFDNTAALWDVSDPGRPGAPRTLAGHTAPVAWLAFSPDGRVLATASNDHTTRLWDVSDPDRARPRATIRGHRDIVRSVAFSPDGRLLATASLDDSVRVADVTDPRHPLPLATFTGHTGNVVSVAFGPDGQTLATGSDDYTARLWDLPGPALTGHASSVCWLAFSPDGRTLATVGEDRTVRLWDTGDPRRSRPRATLTGHTDAIWGVAFSPDGRTLATASNDRTARLWDVSDPGRARPRATIRGHTDNVNAVAFSPDGRFLATASLDRTVRLTDVTDRRRPVRVAGFTGDAEGVNAVAFSPDGRLLATAGWNRTARLWDVTDRRNPVPVSVLSGHTDGINALAFSPDGRTLATASFDDTARLWNIADPRRPVPLAAPIGHTDSVNMVAFSPDGHLLATAGNDGVAQVWDLTDPRRPQRQTSLEAHTDRVSSVAFSPDRHTVATGGYDRTALLWETDAERVAARVCRLAHPRITPREWDRHFPGLPYRPPCP
ncbi:nSTAND1 domain-containing NTPase [Streptosporangium sp. G11]|uniref:nSTAND1 domain-containing NTPase n=1 Tax=Streptosporangium sp. G11 TaxID=3436926 RepID=UPI003EB87158